MENPNSYNPIQKIIFEAINQHQRDVDAGMIGYSNTMYVYNALKEANVLHLDTNFDCIKEDCYCHE